MAYGDGGWVSGGGQTLSISDSKSHTWHLLKSVQGTTSNGGITSVWWCYLSTAPGSMTVTVTTNGTGPMIKVDVWDGANPSQSGATVASKNNSGTGNTTASTSLTTTTTGSWVGGIVGDPTTNSSYTPLSTISLNTVHADSSDNTCAFSFRAASITGTPGSATYGLTLSNSDNYQVILVEVLPAAAAAAPRSLIRGGALRRSTQW
ncbi:MAG: hypothetical protein ACRDQU_00805 [Pseudonocardiaceae bacterium]